VNDQINTYTSYARGRRPASIDFSNHSDVFDLQEEIVDSYEFGAKYESDDKALTLDSAVFYYDYSNFQTQFASESIGYDLEGSGEASTKGAELSGTALITETLSIFYNAAYIDSKVDDDPEFKLAGHRFRLTSEWTGAFGASYRDQVAEIGTGYINLTYTFKSDVFFDDDNDSDNGVNREGAIGLTNMKIGLVSLSDEWETSLFVNNIFDKEYIIDAGNVGSFFGVSTFIPGPPRFYGANGVWRF
jgi:outer membrane receptor protein involved in Fe transport